MIGAPALAARAALRSGCGLCTVAVPAPILPAVLSIIPAAIGVALPMDANQHLFAAGCAQVIDEALVNADALVVGPGFGRDQPQQQIVIRLANAFTKPLILDADALRALAHTPDFARDLNAPIIMTPHPGEFAALAERQGDRNRAIEYYRKAEGVFGADARTVADAKRARARLQSR